MLDYLMATRVTQAQPPAAVSPKAVSVLGSAGKAM